MLLFSLFGVLCCGAFVRLSVTYSSVKVGVGYIHKYIHTLFILKKPFRTKIETMYNLIN